MTMDPAVEAPAAPQTAGAPPEPKPNLFARIAGVLFAPAKTFEDIARRPTWVGMLILNLLLTIAGAAIISSRVDFVTGMREQLEQRHVPADQIDRTVRMMGSFAKVAVFFGPFFSAVALLLVAGVLLLAFRMMGGEGTFRQAWAVTLYAWIPLLLFSIASDIVVLARPHVRAETINSLVRSSPAFLTSPLKHPALYGLLSALDLFNFWSIALLAIGFSYVSRFSKPKSAVLVVIVWLCFVLGRAGISAIFSSLGPR